ncbi:IS66 family insertion sequence element accessory protein TnpA [Bradyrhizobium sp. CCBAU 11434]|uniref:IS66 family insertion sequence element accessory protein TnpA n=1 Tax=Bradyrhizobium sp. CCBAU 11434 TaxID=1630885 RepID=UPI002304E613|nr:hypothetical protein [Bradyrhizobium sp. CCBAU 11434]
MSLHTFPLVCCRSNWGSLLLWRFSGGANISRTRARREWWSRHIEAWRRSGLGIRKYCQQQRLTENTLRRWLKRLAGNEAALKLEKYQTELRRERAREQREK